MTAIKLLKNNLITIIFILFIIFLIFFSSDNLTATKDGIELWSKNVVPSLLPFFIATELLNYTDIAKILGKCLSKVMRPLFNVPGEGAYALIMGIVSGYPVGAKIVTDLYQKNMCTKDEAERMLAFTNNSGPLFIIGTVGILLFRNSTIGYLLFITHILSGITVGILLGIYSRIRVHKRGFDDSYNKNTGNLCELSFSNLGNILSQSISKAITTTLQIGGFVIIFSILLSILNNLNIIDTFCNMLEKISIPHDFSKGLISGIIELTNGVKQSANINVKNISMYINLCAFLIGFGGLSILLQVMGIISKTHLKIKYYFFGKILQGLIAVIYTSVLIHSTHLFNFDLSYIIFSQI
ncbi:MAG: sporulation integral membrane protein YlbJ [Clostridia bacterium]|nr:sporulation integral membrane protein YlbJ [Clostridia bacterium]